MSSELDKKIAVIESALREERQRLKLAVQFGRVGVWDYDLVTGKLWWNETMFDLYKVSPDKFNGAYQDFDEAINPEDAPVVAAEVRKCIEEGSSFNFSFRLRDNSRWIRGCAEVVYDEEGKPSRMVGVNTEDYGRTPHCLTDCPFAAKVKAHALPAPTPTPKVFARCAKETYPSADSTPLPQQ